MKLISQIDDGIAQAIAISQIERINRLQSELSAELLQVGVDEGLVILASIFVDITADPKDPDNCDDPEDRMAYFQELVEEEVWQRANDGGSNDD
jgi:hypothetical protein